MEGGIETGNLRDTRKFSQRCVDHRQSCGHMERCQRRGAFELIYYSMVDEAVFTATRAAMNNTMPNGVRSRVSALRKILENLRRGNGLICAFVVLRNDHVPLFVSDGKTSSGLPYRIRLAEYDCVHFCIVHAIKAKFQGR